MNASQLWSQFLNLPIEQKKIFITNLKEKLLTGGNKQYVQLLNDCIKHYNGLIKSNSNFAIPETSILMNKKDLIMQKVMKMLDDSEKTFYNGGSFSFEFVKKVLDNCKSCDSLSRTIGEPSTSLYQQKEKIYKYLSKIKEGLYAFKDAFDIPYLANEIELKRRYKKYLSHIEEVYEFVQTY